MLRTSFVSAGFALALLAAPLGAQAQPAQPPAGDPAAQAATEAARARFEEGVAHMAASRWQEAADAFAASMQVRATASAALNLGISLKNLGRLVEARVRLQQFQEMASETLRREQGAHAQELLLQIARELARVRVVELTPTVAAVSVDGRRAQLNEAGEVVVDPGAHTVRAEAPGYVTFEERVEVPTGQTRDLRIAMAAAPAAATTPPAPVERVVVVNQPTPAPAATPVYRQWWFWTIIGVGVAGVATGAILATRNTVRDDPPTSTGISLAGITLGGAP
ncbi:MAG: PEGA domain-containing protein [Polyangiales bacterium]